MKKLGRLLIVEDDLTGLGLAICKRLVNAMEGEIGLESEDGAGSSFWIKIPVVEGELADLPAIVAPIQILNSSLSVLLVEDEKTNQEVALAMLEQMGCTTTLVEDGHKAIEAIRNNEFDLVFMDIQMPGIDGWETTQKIRDLKDQKKASLPIIAMTAYAMKEDADRCYEAGMDGFITKPILMEKISEILQSIETGKTTITDRESIEEMGDVFVSLEILDVNKLEKMQSDLSTAGFSKIVSACLTSLTQCNKLFEEAHVRQDFEQMARQAHKLKGAAGACGLGELFYFSENVERKARKNEIIDNSSIAEELRELVVRSSDRLNDWLKDSSLPPQPLEGNID